MAKSDEGLEGAQTFTRTARGRSLMSESESLRERVFTVGLSCNARSLLF